MPSPHRKSARAGPNLSPDSYLIVAITLINRLSRPVFLHRMLQLRIFYPNPPPTRPQINPLDYRYAAMDLHEKIRTLPTRPGVYLYKNADGEVIYVGKARNLRSRVRSYLLEAAQANAKTGSLMRDAVDVDYILVDNEHEALALENNLIKQRKPRFNILLRDDKTYPYVKLTLGDRFPKVFVTRRLRRDGSVYYGPYFPGNLAYRVVDLIHRSFLIPSCKVDLTRYHARPCLQYYIGRCLGPCVEGLTTPEIYREAVRDAQMFLEGRTQELTKSLHERMAAAAAAEQYELAAKYRDLLVTIDQLSEKQRIASADDDDADVFGYHFENGMIAVNLFHMRTGKIVDRREFFWEDLADLIADTDEPNEADCHPEQSAKRDAEGPAFAFDPGAFFSALLKQIYIDQPYVPRTIYVPVDFSDRETLSGLLATHTKHRVEIAVPQRGEKRSLVDLAAQNAKQSYDQRFRVLAPSRKAIQEALAGRAHARRPAPHHRVLRHLPHPGRGNRRLHGRLGRRRDEEERLPQIQNQIRRRRRRLRLHARSHHPPLPRSRPECRCRRTGSFGSEHDSTGAPQSCPEQGRLGRPRRMGLAGFARCGNEESGSAAFVSGHDFSRAEQAK